MRTSIGASCLLNKHKSPAGCVGRRLLHTTAVSHLSTFHDRCQHDLIVAPDGQALIGTHVHKAYSGRPTHDQGSCLHGCRRHNHLSKSTGRHRHARKGRQRQQVVSNMVSWRSMRAFNAAIWARTVVVDVAGPRAADGNGACGGTTLDATHCILAHWFIGDPSSSALDAGSVQSRHR